MVGGQVVEVCEHPRDKARLYIDVIETTTVGTRCPEHCAIYVERNPTSEQIQIGDAIWWQGRFAMWTPQANRNRPEGERLRCEVDYDIKIPRIGYSGVGHPFGFGYNG